jgi:hypothetical protein
MHDYESNEIIKRFKYILFALQITKACSINAFYNVIQQKNF